MTASSLSEREREVLFLAAEGMTDKQIAARLDIRAKTVRTYWDRIRTKLAAASRTQALGLALREVTEEEHGLRLAAEAALRFVVESAECAMWVLDAELATRAVNSRMADAVDVPLEKLRAEGLTAFGLLRTDHQEFTLQVGARRLLLRHAAEINGYLATLADSPKP